MFFMEYNHGKTRSIWEETSEQWDEVHPSWKTVGYNPTRIFKTAISDDPLFSNRENKLYPTEHFSSKTLAKNILEKSNSECLLSNRENKLYPTEHFSNKSLLENKLYPECLVFSMLEKKIHSIEHIFSHVSIYYKLKFSSGRECIGLSKHMIEPGAFVIIEADRGEDCAIIKEAADSEYSGEFKTILRMATDKDIEILEIRKKQEIKALEKCISLVKEHGYSMEITRCEFQWDMKKITFYFRSSKRIDFRDLVKELFKYFKIRIWMSMENRSAVN